MMLKLRKNVQQNIDYIAKQNKKYKAHSYSFASTIDPTSFLRLQLKYSKGFRAPTSDEMYFTFKHPDFTILPNTNLKPEIAKQKKLLLHYIMMIGDLFPQVCLKLTIKTLST